MTLRMFVLFAWFGLFVDALLREYWFGAVMFLAAFVGQLEVCILRYGSRLRRPYPG